MEKKKQLSRAQNVVWQVGSITSMIGIYFFLSTQTDMRQPFMIGLYLVICAAIVWGMRRYVLDNVDDRGRPIWRDKK